MGAVAHISNSRIALMFRGFMDSAPKNRIPFAVFAVPVVVLLCGVLPRAIVAWLGTASPWTAYLYQYAMGGLVFAIGLIVIRVSGACNFERPGDRNWFRILVFGYIWYAAIHGVLVALSTAVPFRGAAG